MWSKRKRLKILIVLSLGWDLNVWVVLLAVDVILIFLGYCSFRRDGWIIERSVGLLLSPPPPKKKKKKHKLCNYFAYLLMIYPWQVKALTILEEIFNLKNGKVKTFLGEIKFFLDSVVLDLAPGWLVVCSLVVTCFCPMRINM